MQRVVPETERDDQAAKCSLYVPGRKKYAYVVHYKREEKIEVWPLGPIESLQKVSSLPVEPRSAPVSGGWSQYEGRFRVGREEQIEDATKILRLSSSLSPYKR